MYLISSFEIIVHLLKAVTCCQALLDLKNYLNFARFYWFTRQLVDKIRTPFLYVLDTALSIIWSHLSSLSRTLDLSVDQLLFSTGSQSSLLVLPALYQQNWSDRVNMNWTLAFVTRYINFTFHSFTCFFDFVRVVCVHIYDNPQIWLEPANVRASWLLYKCACRSVKCLDLVPQIFSTELLNVAHFTDISMTKLITSYTFNLGWKLILMFSIHKIHFATLQREDFLLLIVVMKIPVVKWANIVRIN